MNQIITLLQNLFSLTKVASVTLPGLLAAGGLALILWPAIPVDLIPLATVRPVQELASFKAVKATEAQGTSLGPDVACPGENLLGRHNAYDQACQVRLVAMTEILDSIKEEEQKDQQACKEDEQSKKDEQPKKDAQPKAEDLISSKLQDICPQLVDIQRRDTYPKSRKQQIQQQLILDFENQKFSECINLDTSLKGREAAENQQLTADLDIEEKQRSSAQDNYLAYLKSNNLFLASRYRREMDNFQGCITLKRYSVLWNDRDIQERDRQMTELTRDQGIITARLADPGRLRPRLGFDDFVTGLVNHVVAFILLSLAAAIIVTALDRTVFFGGLFEDLFDGF
jgi:hypothetical protein